MTNPSPSSAENEQAAKVAASVAKSSAPVTGKAVKAPSEGGKVIRTAPAGSRRRRAAKERRQGPFIKYVGDASTRSIRPADWRSLGIAATNAKQPDVWNIANDKMIESSKFSEEQLDYLLIDDFKADGGHSFLEVDYNEKGQLAQVIYEEEA